MESTDLVPAQNNKTKKQFRVHYLYCRQTGFINIQTTNFSSIHTGNKILDTVKLVFQKKLHYRNHRRYLDFGLTCHPAGNQSEAVCWIPFYFPRNNKTHCFWSALNLLLTLFHCMPSKYLEWRCSEYISTKDDWLN